jgi:hypothetical protein
MDKELVSAAWEYSNPSQSMSARGLCYQSSYQDYHYHNPTVFDRYPIVIM